MVVWLLKLVFLVFVGVTVLAKKPRKLHHGVKLSTCRPLVIAHRGASGILPEHTGKKFLSVE